MVRLDEKDGQIILDAAIRYRINLLGVQVAVMNSYNISYTAC